MGEPVKKNTESNNLEDWDSMIVAMIIDLFGLAKNCASENVLSILKTSKSFLGKSVHEAIKNFHNLYFKNSEYRAKSESFNSDIDNIVDLIQDDMKKHGNATEASIKKAKDALDISESERLQLAQAQKQIESLISMQESIKTSVMPILASMQFEDMMRQRLDHIEIGLNRINQLSENCTDKEIDTIINDLEKICASKEEIAEFYEEVKKESPPENFQNKSSVIAF